MDEQRIYGYELANLNGKVSGGLIYLTTNYHDVEPEQIEFPIEAKESLIAWLKSITIDAQGRVSKSKSSD